MEAWLSPFLEEKAPRGEHSVTLSYDVFEKGTGKRYPVSLDVRAEVPPKSRNVWFPGSDSQKAGDFRVIEIDIPRPGNQSECMYMVVALPLSARGVPHAWLSTLLYDGGNPIDPVTCPFTDNVPIRAKIGWGTFLLNFAIEIAKFFGCYWIGLTDGSFVTKCGEKVPFSDYRRTAGKQPWYEENGFIEMATDTDFTFGDRVRLSVASQFSDVRRKIETNHRRYLRDLKKCRNSRVKTCYHCTGSGCPDCEWNTTVGEAGKMLTDLMDSGTKRACKAFDKYTNECMYKFTARKKGRGHQKDRVLFLKSGPNRRRGTRRRAAKSAQRRLTAYYRK